MNCRCTLIEKHVSKNKDNKFVLFCMYIKKNLQTFHSKQANRALKRKELLKRKKKRIIETKESDTSMTRPGCETLDDFTHHTSEAAVVLLGGRSLPQAVFVDAPR